MTTMTATLRKCSPCHGKGVRPEYGHRFGGICFHCNGKGKMMVSKPAKARKGNFSVDEINEMLTKGQIGKA